MKNPKLSIIRFFYASFGHPTRGVPHLEYLNLVGTRVTDAGIQHLAGLKGLKNVFVWKSAVTEAGVAQLRKARPDLNIVTGLDEVSVAAFIQAGGADSTQLAKEEVK